jgi:hypothetical protein
MDAVQQYLRWLEEIAGERSKIYDIGGKDTWPQLIVVMYEDLPEPGYTTTYSFGLSSVEHKEWKLSRPELVISVNSSDMAWGLAMGELIKQERGISLFEYGSIFNFGEPISDESEMSAFLVFANSLYDKGDESIDLADRKISLSQLYPIYQEEIELIKSVGAENFFFHYGIDFYNVQRRRKTLKRVK